MADVDASELNRLAADMRQVPRSSAPYLHAAAETTARGVRDTARTNAMGMAHAPAFPFSITYDQVGSNHGGGAVGAFVGGSGEYDIAFEVGPDKDRPQGALGNLIEFGSVNNPPQGIMHGALQANQADFERGIDKAVEDGLRAAGL
ncbi:hypothetical protein Q9R08_05195 [Microbacterium sp. QXD-8]|uniref:HK97 gp10 family phage protein n=1 Tax=Microbacterium psychrotolerans TaxID=3068321 RepID=A0ABU0YYF4_9MICO|nr:hypothetical protein [Microbacterium sp. QXD-8]MDQ7877369.1 hypothetical protein [Microbacterium sp. QXD-8]